MTDNTATQVDLSQCSFVTDKGRRCKLAAGHEGTHRMVIRGEVAKPKTLAELRTESPDTFAGFSLKMEAVPANADLGREYNREAEPRDADQQRVDKDAAKAYADWERAGKPENFDSPNAHKAAKRYVVPPQAFNTVIAMLRRATDKGGPVTGKRLSYRRKEHDSGQTVILFMFADPKPHTDATVNGSGTSGN